MRRDYFFLIGFLIASVACNFLLSGEILQSKIALSASREKASQINRFTEKSNDLKADILELHIRNNQLRELLGLNITEASPKITKTISETLQDASLIAQADKKMLKELKIHVADVYQKMVSLPSKWPIYGKIESNFGYRLSPWRGFHSGIDIKGIYGTPFRVTAPGVVTYSGWRAGYGQTIEVRHKYGFSTLYAHCSKILVSSGQQVTNGQIIGRVGVTGYSTGSHLHYEVKRDNQAINPSPFMDLRILAAARIVK